MRNRSLQAMAVTAAIVAIFAVGIAEGAAAADKPREASFGKGRAAGPLLTPAQLRDCLAQQDRVRSRTDETAREQAVLGANKAEIDRLGIALKEQFAVLDRTSADAVSAYNTQVGTRDKLIDDYEAAVPPFNAKVEALKADQATFLKACENRRYDENDEIAIRKGKR